MTPKGFIDKQCRRRLRGKVIPPCVKPVTYETYPISTPYGATSPIGKPWSLGRHTGEDHACPVGSLAVAVSWGTVIGVYHPGGGIGVVPSWGADFGVHVIIRQANGEHDYAYCHLERALVSLHAQVKPGEVVGLTGQSGNTRGPHLHLEARPAGGRFGSDVNPLLVKRKDSTP